MLSQEHLLHRISVPEYIQSMTYIVEISWQWCTPIDFLKYIPFLLVHLLHNDQTYHDDPRSRQHNFHFWIKLFSRTLFVIPQLLARLSGCTSSSLNMLNSWDCDHFESSNINLDHHGGWSSASLSDNSLDVFVECPGGARRCCVTHMQCHVPENHDDNLDGDFHVMVIWNLPGVVSNVGTVAVPLVMRRMGIVGDLRCLTQIRVVYCWLKKNSHYVFLVDRWFLVDGGGDFTW